MGKFLREKRESQKLSLRQLEKLSKKMQTEGETGLTYSHISKIENGEVSPSIQTLQKIAAVLELPLIVVLDGKLSQPTEVTVVSTSEFSQLLSSVLSREEMVQLMMICQDLPTDQLKVVLDLAKSLSKSSSRQDDEGAS